MADKLNEFAQKMGKGGAGGPPGKIPLLFKLGAAGIAAAYGLNQAMYTGTYSTHWLFFEFWRSCLKPINERL